MTNKPPPKRRLVTNGYESVELQIARDHPVGVHLQSPAWVLWSCRCTPTTFSLGSVVLSVYTYCIPQGFRGPVGIHLQSPAWVPWSCRCTPTTFSLGSVVLPVYTYCLCLAMRSNFCANQPLDLTLYGCAPAVPLLVDPVQYIGVGFVVELQLDLRRVHLVIPVLLVNTALLFP